MTTTPVTTLTVRRTFAAPRSDVFAVFTDPNAIMQRWCPPEHQAMSAQADVRVEGHYRIEMHSQSSGLVTYVSGVYREIQPPAKLVFTHIFEAPTSGSGEQSPLINRQTLVGVKFIAQGETTEVVLMQENSPDETASKRLGNGWEMMLNTLELFLRQETQCVRL